MLKRETVKMRNMLGVLLSPIRALVAKDHKLFRSGLRGLLEAGCFDVVAESRGGLSGSDCCVTAGQVLFDSGFETDDARVVREIRSPGKVSRPRQFGLTPSKVKAITFVVAEFAAS